MHECICSSCKNLKSVGDIDRETEFECEFGYPSEVCEDCEKEECGEICEHYECDDEEMVSRVVLCKECGKELTQVLGDNEAGEIYCVDCFLKGGNR